MKKFYILLFLSVITAAVNAQSAKQVQWVYTAKKIADKTYEVHMTATIGDNYHLYAQDAGVEGPLPTTFKFTGNPLAVTDGKVKEAGKVVKKFESAWNPARARAGSIPRSLALRSQNWQKHVVRATPPPPPP